MITASQGASRRAKAEKGLSVTDLEDLRVKINSEEYVQEAIQQMALRFSNQYLDIPQGGNHEQQRKGRR